MISKVKTTQYFQSKYNLLRPSQKDRIKTIIKAIQKNPEMGEPGKEEWRDYRYYLHDDQYGKTLICYRVSEDVLRLVSLSQISIKI